MPIPVVYLTLKYIQIYLYVISQGSSRNLLFYKRMVSGILIPGKPHSKVISDSKSHKQSAIKKKKKKQP